MSTIYGIPKNGIAYNECNWHPYTPTVASDGSQPTFGALTTGATWRRCHPTSDSIDIIWTFRQTSSGGAGSGTYLINLPPGFHINPKVFSLSVPNMVDQAQSAPLNLGPAYLDTSGNSQFGMVSPYGSTDLNKLMLIYLIPSGAATIWSAANFPFSNTNINVAIRATIPVQEYANS